MWDTVSSADSGSDSLAAGVPELVAGVPAHDLESESAQAQNPAWGPVWDRGYQSKTGSLYPLQCRSPRNHRHSEIYFLDQGHLR